MLPTRHAAHKWVSLHPGMDLTRASVLFTNTIKKAKKVNITPLFKLKNMLLRYDCSPTDFIHRGNYVFCVRDNLVITLYQEGPALKSYFTYRYGNDALKFQHLFLSKSVI